MKAFFYSLLFLVVFSGYTQAQSKTSATATKDNSLFWKVSGNGLKAPSYLFGTYHFAGKTFIDSLGYITPKFKDCKTVVGEVILDQSDMLKYMGYMTMPDNSLDKLFTPEEYKQIAETNKQLTGMDLAAFNKLKPAALQTLWIGFLAQKTITEANQAMDIYFQQEGKSNNDKLIGLETIDFQMNLLLNGKMDDQKKHLMAFVKKHDEFKTEFAKLYRLYQQQDLDGLNKMMFATDEYTPAELDDMLKNRNLKWMEQLPGIMNEQSAFVAVGAGHLIGQYGLINQLRLKGYTVTAVRN